MGTERLTRRPLPEHDALIEQLDPGTRRTLGRIWADRAQSELNAGSGFAIVVTELYELGADNAVIRLATRAAHDEARHSELCRLLAEAYLGEPVPSPRPKRVGMPQHAGVDDSLRRHLHVVGLCCINETLAVGFVEACLETTEAPLVRAVQHEHLTDEIDHARVGWAHLASEAVDARTRGGIGELLPRLLRANLSLWRSRIAELPEEGVAAHGYPPRERLLRAVDETVQGVILPGFRHVDITLPARHAVI